MKKSILIILTLTIALFLTNVELIKAASLIKIKESGGIKVSGMPASHNGQTNIWTCGDDNTRTCYETNEKGIFTGSGGTFALSNTRIDIFLYTDANDPNIGIGYVDAITINDITEQNCSNVTLSIDSQTQQVSNFINWITLTQP